MATSKPSGRQPDTANVGARPTVSGEALICELAASELFGEYIRAFPAVSSDAGRVLRIAVQVGIVDRYLQHLERALNEQQPVSDAEWHALLGKVSWPRPLPEWCRQRPEPIVIDGHGPFDFGEPWNVELPGSWSFPSTIWMLAQILVVCTLVIVVGLVLRVLPRRAARPLMKRFDKALVSILPR